METARLSREKQRTERVCLIRTLSSRCRRCQGEIWPNSEVEVTVTFSPEVAHDYTSLAYLEVTGREGRLPLELKAYTRQFFSRFNFCWWLICVFLLLAFYEYFSCFVFCGGVNILVALQGEGLGPKVRFSFDRLDIGGVFVNSQQQYEVLLQNTGHIDAPFQLQPYSSQKFQVFPTNGVVRPGEQVIIRFKFEPDFVGDFDEPFCWRLQVPPLLLLLLFLFLRFLICNSKIIFVGCGLSDHEFALRCSGCKRRCGYVH